MTFIDDYSRRVSVVCIQRKSDVFSVFKEFKTRMETVTGKKLITLRSDNGKEYCNRVMSAYLREAGITHQTTVPYTPEQNGVAERMNRTLVEKARCMLFDAGLPMKFWADAVCAAAYLNNRVLTRSTKAVPEELWAKKKPDMNELRVFGCQAMAHIPSVQRAKFAPKSKRCIFMGYCTTQKGYRMYDPVSRKYFVSRDIKFNEELKGGLLFADNCTNMNHFFFPEDRNEVEENSATADGNEQDEAVADGRVDVLGGGEQGVMSLDEQNAEQIEGDGNNDGDDNGDDVRDAVEVSNDAVSGLRRSTRNRVPVKRYEISHAVTTNVAQEPETPDEALNGPNADHWKKAMDEEFKSLLANGTWSLVDLPPGRKAISNKWVFKTKYDGDGNIDRFKARLVVKGCSQRHGIDYEETFSPVVRYTSIRFLLAIAAKMNLEIDQMDVVTAFLNGDLKEEVYMQQPAVFADGTKRVCRLRKSLYGLKQASRSWNEKLGAVLERAGLKSSKVDTCIYYRINAADVLIVAVYVDDILILSNSNSSKQYIKKQLKAAFKMTDNGEATFILGMHIERDRRAGTISIDQHKYLEEVLAYFNMDGCNPVSTPVDIGTKLTGEMAPKTEAEREEMRQVPYQQAVGKLLFAAQVSRPDIQFAVNMVSRFNKNPGRAHWNAVKRIMRYIRGTVGMKLTYRRGDSLGLHGFCDADWASDGTDRKSVTGYVYKMQGGAISWMSKKQATVALSTTEAEYMAMSTATQEAIWLRNLNNELFGAQCKQIVVYGDNKSALLLSEKPTTFHSRTKHIDIRYHFIRDNVSDGTIKFIHTPTDNMTADILTKAVPLIQHVKCRNAMNIQ